MKTLYINFLIYISFSVLAQDDKVLVPSPEAASLIKWSKNEVNLSTGSLNSMVPIYTLKDGGLEVPIALHYNGSSGIKVEESANMVGLGWDLVAGGKIVRIVRDKPDESYTLNHIRNEKGGFDGFEIGVDGNPAGNIIGQSRVSVQWKNEKYNYRGGWYLLGNPFSSVDFQKNDPVLFDSQPDIFIVNIGNDIIKFTFDNYKTPVIINNKDYKIEIEWQPYNPGIFLTKQSWSINANIGLGDAVISQLKSVTGLGKDFLPTSLGVTIGLNQIANLKDTQYPKVIGFRGFIITASNGTKYHFGGSEEFLEYNFNDQAYLNDIDRLAIAVNNLSQRIPYAWALRKIESPFGTNKNKIDFKYKRTGFYEPFNSSDNKVDEVTACSFPTALQEKSTRSIFGSLSFSDSVITNLASLATVGVINASYSKPSKEDLAAYVTLNTRVIFGLFPESITSPNFKVIFNDNELLYANLDLAKINRLVPNFNSKQFYDVERLDSRPEGSLSSAEERNKGLVDYNKLSQQLTLKNGNVTVQGPAIATLGLNGIINNLDSLSAVFKGDYKQLFRSLFPTVTYQGNGVSAGVNGNGAFVNWSGKIYEVDIAGEFKELLVPNQKIKNIQILDLNTNKKKGYYFDYDYFKTYNNSGTIDFNLTKENYKFVFNNIMDPGVISDLPKDMYTQLHEKYGVFYTEDKLRLQLKGVYEVVNKNDVVSLLPGTTFKYNNTPLPRRLSMAQDYWGYYNGQHDNRNKSQLVSRPIYTTYNSMLSFKSGIDGDPLCPNSSDLRPNLQFSQAGILNEIQFATGAKKIFKYELHAANDYFGKVGGLRISEITSIDQGTNQSYYEKFKYISDQGKSSGQLSIIPDYYFKHSLGNTRNPVILPNYTNLLSSYFINDGYISYTKVTRYDSSSTGKLNGYTEHYFSNSESNPKRKNPVLESEYELYPPRNIYQVITLPSGATSNKQNTIIDIDPNTIDIQLAYEAQGEGFWSLDTALSVLRFTPYSTFSGFPTVIRFDYFEKNNPNKFSATTNIIPYNYGQGGQIIEYSVDNSYFRLGGIPRYDYSKNSIQQIKVYNNQNKLVKLNEYKYTGSDDYSRITSKIEGANVISIIPITKFSVGISIGIFFNAATVVKPEFGIAFKDRIVRSAEVYPYSVNIERYDLLTEKETSWDTNGENPVSTESNYKYSFNHHNPIETSMINSKDQNLINKTTYSLDIFPTAIDSVNFSSLPDINDKIDPSVFTNLRYSYINLPIEEISLIDSMVVAGKFLDIYNEQFSRANLGLPKIEYVLELEAPIPKSQFMTAKTRTYNRLVNNSTGTGFENQFFPKFIFDARYVPRIYIDEYNSRGLPSKYKKSGDAYTKVDYGFNDLIPVSKTVAFGTSLARTTNYSYIPLYGLTQVTNPNLTGQKYDYDEIGRLKAVRNEQNEILKSYVYKILGF